MSSDVYHIVQNSRRRRFLKVLQELGGTASLREVIRRIALHEGNGSYNKRMLKSIQVSLLQTHLPKMEHAGLIMYNAFDGTVSLLELPPTYRYHLETIDRHDISWSGYYLVLSFSGLLLSFITQNLLAGVFASAVFVGSLLHRYQMKNI